MNTIYSEQNNVTALKSQASARYYYNKADFFEICYWVGIIFTIVLKMIWSNYVFIDYLLIIWFFMTIILDNCITKYTAKSSEFKQIFDEYVFGWKQEISDKTIKEIKLLEMKHKEFFNAQINHSGNDKPRGVKDWYEFVDETEDQETALKSAIGESIYYDRNINFILVIILVFIMVLSVVYFRNSSITDYLKTIFLTLSSLSKKTITVFLKTFRIMKLNNEIDIRLDSAKSQDDFKEIQNIIFIKRQISEVTPSWIYFTGKNKITKSAQTIFPNKKK